MYHYEECGLPNVWLVNGYTEHETPYGKAVNIENTNGLHQCIAQEIIKSRPRLTGYEFRFLRHELDMSQKQLASVFFGKSDQTVANWEKGDHDVPKYADLIIRTLYNGCSLGKSGELSINLGS
ncbi:MAG: transcriptional regulator [Nitrococcus sp.]|nr:transcriptional regulator [Nitrococcus sp.]